jgi:hypothetical protein
MKLTLVDSYGMHIHSMKQNRKLFKSHAILISGRAEKSDTVNIHISKCAMMCMSSGIFFFSKQLFDIYINFSFLRIA